MKWILRAIKAEYGEDFEIRFSQVEQMQIIAAFASNIDNAIDTIKKLRHEQQPRTCNSCTPSSTYQALYFGLG